MYECPINITSLPVATEFDGEVLKVVHQAGINVDRDELLKALQYDRDQYNKGFSEGIKAFGNSLKESAISEIRLGEERYFCIKESDIDAFVAETKGEYNG